MGTGFTETKGHSIDTKKLEELLLNLSWGDILFVDEIHAIRTKVAEMLYSPMQDFIYEGHMLPRFTLVGATTNIGQLPKPMRDRIVHRYQFVHYTDEQIAEVICHHRIAPKIAKYIAQRSKGVPRHAVQFIKKIGAYMDKNKGKKISLKHCDEAFNALGIDKFGLDETDRVLVGFLFKHKAITASSAIGLEAIVSSLDLTKEVYSNMIEPYLLSIELIQRTPRGRILTPKGLAYAKKYA